MEWTYISKGKRKNKTGKTGQLGLKPWLIRQGPSWIVTHSDFVVGRLFVLLEVYYLVT